MRPPDPRLSRIVTLWTLVRQAHADSGEDVAAAQRALLDRYGGAVRRYLLGSLRDRDAAEEVFQEFACRLLKGDLSGADSDRGRFRDYVKGVLFHLVANWHNQRRRQPQALVAEPAAPDPPSMAEEDRAFLENWRAELLARAWTALSAYEQQTGQPCYTVLRLRAEQPQLRSPELAGRLSEMLSRPISAVAVRQALHRARDRFADLLLEEIRHSLAAPTAERLEEELVDLGLLEYCRPALDRLKAEG
jgi:DNA-directed RNA polymerase specialized sigma24 family protein